MLGVALLGAGRIGKVHARSIAEHDEARLAWVCAAGAGTYFGALWLLGFRLSDFDRREAEVDPAAAVDTDADV